MLRPFVIVNCLCIPKFLFIIFPKCELLNSCPLAMGELTSAYPSLLCRIVATNMFASIARCI
jgi:hypothetical protein